MWDFRVKFGADTTIARLQAVTPIGERMPPYRTPAPAYLLERRDWDETCPLTSAVFLVAAYAGARLGCRRSRR
jgi:hypothetical protein